MFPGKRAGLSGDTTRPALLRSPLGIPLADPSLELGRPGLPRPRDPLLVGPSSGNRWAFLGVVGREWVRFVWLPL